MEKFDANTKIEHLVKTLNYYTKLYDMGTPAISDAEWDKMYFELMQLEKDFPSLVCADSPTQKIKYEVVSELKKVKHEYQPMLSLDKTKNIEDIKDFIGNKDWIAMLKLDGLTCRLTYNDGYLVRAETRGNGIEGEDITHNAMIIPSIPKRIPYYDTLVVDGEMICNLQTFEQFKGEYANARNFAAGSIRLLDSNECTKRGLQFIAWDAIQGEQYVALTGKLYALENKVPFQVVPYIDDSSNLTIEEAIETLKAIATQSHYPIDGIVFKWNDVEEYEAAGRTDHHFRGGMAYKFYDEEYETELLDIEWTMGRTGVLTPVAIYEDVDTGDSINNRASLHNVSIMKELLGEPYIGQKIWIAKMNQIIPQVVKADKESAPFITLEIPTICPVCLGEAKVIESDSGTLELHCMNDACQGKLINRLDHFCGKKGLDIKGLSKATLEKLIDWGWVTRAKDIFYLYQRENEWVKKAGFGEKSVRKILDAIEAARHCTLEAFICALGIPLIGKTYAKQLADKFETYQNFRTAVSPDPISGIKPFDFSTISGFGGAMHIAIVSFDYDEADRMVDMSIIDFKESELPKIGNAPSLENLVFCITGKLTHYKNRDALKAEIISCGGKVTDSVTAKTSYLVNNDINFTSAKNKKAKELNIPIITEEDLIKLL